MCVQQRHAISVYSLLHSSQSFWSNCGFICYALSQSPLPSGTSQPAVSQPCTACVWRKHVNRPSYSSTMHLFTLQLKCREWVTGGEGGFGDGTRPNIFFLLVASLKGCFHVTSSETCGEEKNLGVCISVNHLLAYRGTGSLGYLLINVTESHTAKVIFLVRSKVITRCLQHITITSNIRQNSSCQILQQHFKMHVQVSQKKNVAVKQTKDFF